MFPTVANLQFTSTEDCMSGGFKKSKLEPLIHEVYSVQQDLTLPAVFFSYKALRCHQLLAGSQQPLVGITYETEICVHVLVISTTWQGSSDCLVLTTYKVSLNWPVFFRTFIPS